MILLDGRQVASELLNDAATRVLAFQEKGIKPKLVVILVGDDPASEVYVKHKVAACEKTGVISEKILYSAAEMSTEKLVAKIEELNKDPEVHGILVQLPLPDHVEAPKVIKAINPQKDVDGFTAYNMGKVLLSTDFEDLAPCTPKGMIKLLEYYKIPTEGKEVVVVGSSNIVGKPIAIMLSNRKATVTICNSRTQNLAEHTRRADILVVAVGKPKLITADMVKDGAVVLDVGINRLENGKLCGDTDFDALIEKVSYITPVPGGVGPMTVACLIDNVLRATARLTNNN